MRADNRHLFLAVISVSSLWALCKGNLQFRSTSGNFNGIPYTPCPNYFYYYKDSRTGESMGALQIPPPQDSTKIYVEIVLHLPVYFKSVSVFFVSPYSK
jgi:hypothetical protein